MAYQQREGQGSLFRNEKQNDRQPDFRGTILIKGITYNISAWNRTSQNGREYISLQAEERNQDSAQGSYRQSAPSYQAPSNQGSSYQTPSCQAPDIPAPTADDMPEFEDLPF